MIKIFDQEQVKAQILVGLEISLNVGNTGVPLPQNFYIGFHEATEFRVSHGVQPKEHHITCKIRIYSSNG